MKGYFKNPKATDETMWDGWLYTGDNAYYDEQGYFYFVDRGKDIIKRGGENVAPSEIEAAIKQVDGVADVAVVGMPDAMFDEVPQAFVIPQPGCDIDRRGDYRGVSSVTHAVQSSCGSHVLRRISQNLCREDPETSAAGSDVGFRRVRALVRDKKLRYSLR